jgi:hypothetical protein
MRLLHPRRSCLYSVMLAGCSASLLGQVSAQEVRSSVETPAISEAIRVKAIEKWEKDIVALEQLDAKESDPQDGVLLIGSSSIRLWTTCGEDLSPYPTIRRGYGGAKYSDLAVFAERLIQPHQFRVLVVFVANDISGKEDDATVEQIQQWVTHIVEVARQHQPNSPVFIMEITPTEIRWKVWGRIRLANAMLRELALTTPNTIFVPTAEYFLTNQGLPRTELFRDDKLHLNEKGYALWALILKSRLASHLD